MITEHKFRIIFFSLIVLFIPNHVFAEEFSVSIPFGAFNPELNTPAEVWYDPPTISVHVDDTITWSNDDREGHTITSGVGSGRFGWMSDDFGMSNGIFDSDRFMPGDSWSYTFQEKGTFRYFCTIHPWMEGIVNVEPLIPDYPHDAFGNRIEKFPIINYTSDGVIELDLTWEPNVIKTFEKVVLIYQTYDPASNSNLDKMSYDIIVTQNGNEVFRDSGITQIGGDYRNVVFEEPGPVEIRFENIVSWGTSAIESGAREQPLHPSQRTVQFTTIVYENPEESSFTDDIVQPKQTFQLYYEIAVAIILIPAALFILVLWRMKSGKPTGLYLGGKATPV